MACPPWVSSLLAAAGMVVLAAGAAAGELEASVEGGPTIRIREAERVRDEVRRVGEEDPGALARLRARLTALASPQGVLPEGSSPEGAAFPVDPERVHAVLDDWVAEHMPRVAEVRALGGPDADEAGIAESLALRRALLEEVAAPARDAGDGLASRAGGLLESLRRGMAEATGGQEEEGEGRGSITLAEPPEEPEQAAEPPASEGWGARARRLLRALRTRLGF